jgi:hypothetical protein
MNSLVLLSVLITAAFADDYLTISLRTDSNMRYLVPANMVNHPSLYLARLFSRVVQGTGNNVQKFNFALSMGTPLISVAGTTCTTGCNSAHLYVIHDDSKGMS